ncbi:MAG: hypothetical protein K0S20_351 [Patescibacteria group bacterium]|jgi:hypothetical protein|nr:hypothetical protein [Patescibacteria group bacterium]
MVISYLSDDKVSIKTKTETVTVGNGVQIGQYKVSGAGEYDIAAIQCEAQYLETATAYFLRTEDLTITFLDQIDAQITKLDDASNTDILIVDVRSNEKPEDLKPVLKALEPAYLFLIGAGADSAFQEGVGLPLKESAPLKIVRTGLPMDGTRLITRD